MNIVSKLQDYNPPKVEVVAVQVEQGFSASGDPVITNPDMGWGN